MGDDLLVNLLVLSLVSFGLHASKPIRNLFRTCNFKFDPFDYWFKYKTSCALHNIITF
uniref:Uncharacterized protein n=1 Tax=Rhizophagus irregularis (strain DAOM 181602 / DAOM 197198 / MUCL 43194) TaxID=747089 RepID=U9SP85_RHIID